MSKERNANVLCIKSYPIIVWRVCYYEDSVLILYSVTEEVSTAV